MNSSGYIFEASAKPSLPLHEVPLIWATEGGIQGYGCLVENADDFEIEIIRLPRPGWRPVDDGAGDEAGWVDGTFTGKWQGDVLFGTNDAMGGHFLLGWSTDPQHANEQTLTVPRDKVLLWRLNYHPDCGPVLPAAAATVNCSRRTAQRQTRPGQVVAFWCRGSCGL